MEGIVIKKLLIGYIQDGKHSGIDKYLLNFCTVCYENNVKADFLTDKITSDMMEYMQDMGFGLIEVPSLKKPVLQYKAIKKIIKSNGYDGVYANISESFNCMLPLAAKKCGVPVRIVHSHSSGVDRANKLSRTIRTFLNSVFRCVLNKCATKKYACSSVAGKWLYSDSNFEIIYNAVNKERFGFNSDIRLKKREQFNLTDKHILIHIGNFCYQKNNYFLMDIMAQVKKRDKNAVLLSVGTGSDFDGVIKYAKSLGIDDSVKFLGVRDDVPDLLSTADVFVFPSRFEGLSITCIEAQISGLKCIFADTLSKETKISDNVEFIPLGSAEKWAETVINNIGPRTQGQIYPEQIKNYDISHQKEQLCGIIKGL